MSMGAPAARGAITYASPDGQQAGEERVMATTVKKSRVQRVVAVVFLLVVGILSLPVVAAFLDGGSTESLIVPIQLAVMALVGAITGYLLPGLAGFGSSSARSALVGAFVGLAAALGGIAVFSLLL